MHVVRRARERLESYSGPLPTSFDAFHTTNGQFVVSNGGRESVAETTRSEP